DRATVELRTSNDLDHAYRFSAGPAEAFSQLLATVDSSLDQSLRILAGDLDVDQAHAKIAGRILNNAENLELLITKSLRRARSRQNSIDGEGI
ncbi:hypothetical protein, partial [Diaphorobacter caeni]|uniref:hypothetical protein n=1 Tax=Diaphorobacter caeni TaxID=2784387 RepID=UPI001E44DE81